MLDVILYVFLGFATVLACVWLFIFVKAMMIWVISGDSHYAEMYLKSLDDKLNQIGK